MSRQTVHSYARFSKYVLLFALLMTSLSRVAHAQVQFDDQGNCLVRGNYFFPIGIFTYYWDPLTRPVILDQGFNTIISSIHDGIVPAHLNQLQSDGIMVIPYMADAEYYDAWLTAKDHPAILAWSLMDEPEGRGITPDQQRAEYGRLRAADPSHPIGTAHYLWDALYDYRLSEDFTMSDVYPIHRAPIVNVATYIDRLHEIHGPGYPVWPFIQCFGGFEGFDIPSPAEERVMVYLALAHRSKGIFFFSYYPSLVDTWAEVKTLVGEMEQLAPFYCHPSSEPALGNTNPIIHTRLIRIGNSGLIIAVNPDSSPQTATFTIPAPAPTSLTPPFGGGPTVPVANGSFSLSFNPLSVHIYRWPMPDISIRRPGDPTYSGDDVYTTVGITQRTAYGVPAVYYLKVENSSGDSEELLVTGGAGTEEWTIRYFDSLSGGSDITPQVTGSGWPTGPLTSETAREIRVEVTPEPGATTPTKEVLVTATSTADIPESDSVKALTLSPAAGLEDALLPSAVIMARGVIPGASLNMAAILGDATLGAELIDDYAVWRKPLSDYSAQPTDWRFSADPFPTTVQLLFALSQSGSFYVGASGPMPDVLSAAGTLFWFGPSNYNGVWDSFGCPTNWRRDGGVVEPDNGVYEPKDIGLVGMAYSELCALQARGHVSGLAPSDSDFRNAASIDVKHHLGKPLWVMYYPVFIIRGDEWQDWGIGLPMNDKWCPFASIYDNGPAQRLAHIAYSGAVGSYLYYALHNNNGENTWVALDGIETAHHYNYGLRVGKLYNTYPSTVALGGTKTWSQIATAVTLTTVADQLSIPNWEEDPSLGLRRNPPPDVIVIQPNAWTSEQVAIWRVEPNKGGNAGTVTTTIRGLGLDSGATVKLTKAGEPDVVAQAVTGVPDKTRLTATFDLRGKTSGIYDLVVTNPGGETATLPQGFEVLSGGEPKLWVEMVGQETARVGRVSSFEIRYGNTGTIDAREVVLWASLPQDLPFRVTTRDGSVDISRAADPGGGRFLVYLLANALVTGEHGSLQLTMTPMSSGEFEIGASIDSPLARASETLTSSSSALAGATTGSAGSAGPLLLSANPADCGADTSPCPPPGYLMFWYTDQPGHVAVSLGTIDGLCKYAESHGDLPDDKSGGNIGTLDGSRAGYVGAFPPPVTGFNVDLGERVRDKAIDLINADKVKYWDLLTCDGLLANHGQDDRYSCTNFVDSLFEMCGSDLVKPNRWTLSPAALYEKVSRCKFRGGSGWFQEGVLTAYYGQTCFDESGRLKVSVVIPWDPNDKAGPGGYDPEGMAPEFRRRFISGDHSLGYMVFFENLETATAAAQEVLVTDRLDSDLDWSTFAFESMQVGSHIISVPEYSQAFSADIDLRPEVNAILQVRCSYNPGTGIAEWYFKGVDPDTGDLADFLPPNTEAVDPLGRAWVSYSVKPKPGLATGTEITNRAAIDFEVGVPPEPMDAPESGPWLNTIDNFAPSSSVTSVGLPNPPAPGARLISWSGTDDASGSGVKDYTIYVSDNGGPYTAWLTNSTETSATFTGEYGHTYCFYSRSRDNVGNAEDAPLEPDLTVLIQDDQPPAITITPASGAYLIDAANPLTLDADAVDPSGIARVGATLNGVVVTLPCQISTAGSYQLVVSAVDNCGNTAQETADYTVYRLAFKSPVIRGHAFQAGATIPVKFGIWDGNSTFVTGLSPTITVRGPSPSADIVWTGSARYTYDGQACYQALVRTKGWSPGAYTAVVGCPGILNTVDVGFAIRPSSK